MRKTFVICFCALAYLLNAQHNALSYLVQDYKSNADLAHYDLFKKDGASRQNLPVEIKDFSILKLDERSLATLLHSPTKAIELTLPSSDRHDLTLELVEVTFDGLVIKTSDSEKPLKYNPGRHYRGIVKGQASSIVALSFFENDVAGFIAEERGNGNHVIGKMQDNSGDYIIYNDNDLMKKLNMDCAALDSNIPYANEEINHHMDNRALTDCVKMYFEVDYNIFQQKGGSTQTVNYVTSLYNQVATLYLSESIKTTASEIFVWTTTSPYNGSSSNTMLNQFTGYRNGFNGDIAMLLSYGASGGIAYVNTLCNSNPDYRMGFSSIASSFATVPTYSWSVEVVAHEYGHLLGSQHTHACVWNGNNTAIDGCYAPEGSCANPGLPSGGGTVMSYCHLTSAGINFSNGFGTQPGNVIRSKVTAATCLQACPGTAPATCTDGIQNGQETGIDCGGPTCTPCSTGCTSNSGTYTLVLDNYPTETTWNIKNASNVIVYSGGPYNAPNSTVTLPVCLPNGCYTFNIFDAYGDGICCTYGQGSFNLVVAGTNVASGGQFTTSKTVSFCLGATAPTCTDGIKNGQETGIDCGGPTCPPCAAAPTCTDGIKNGQETGIDCGGPTCPPCSTGCTTNSGTFTLVLDNYPTETTWNIKNASNAIVYSGGPYSAPNSTVTLPVCLPNGCYTFNIFDTYGDGICCTYGQGSFNLVVTGNNVASGGQFTSSKTISFCLGSSAPTCTDGIQNGQETGIDCGGPTCPPCAAAPTCTDGIKNGQETGIDCGGPTCPPCPTTPTCTDGIKNGQETGIDCGGPTCPPCPTTPTCTDGIQNGQETGIDCGGPTCPQCPQSGAVTLGAYYFETGWDNWTDGGEDAERYTGTRSFEGTWSIALRDDSGVLSSMVSPTYTTAPNYLAMQVEFNFYPYSMESGEDFSLQYSNNNGSTWTTIGSWISGTNFNNNTFYAASISINKSAYGFTNTSKFRFVCDASTNSDLIYIDAVKVKGLSTATIIQGGEIAAISTQYEANDGIRVYPNPAQNTINIDLPSSVENTVYDIKLYDMTGKVLSKTQANGIGKIDVSEIGAGMYFIAVSIDGEMIETQKVVINK